jgi:ribonucleotide reductase alpha subunit
MLDLIFDSKEAEILNKAIYSCMYYNALYKSIQLSNKYGPYQEFKTGEFTLRRNENEFPPIGCNKPIKQVRDEKGIVYETFSGSPFSNGFLQFDLWNRRAGVLEHANCPHSAGNSCKGDSENCTERIYLNTDIYDRNDDVPIEPNWYNYKHEGEFGSWSFLRKLMIKHGVRNSLLLTCMPTATTSQILRNAETNECHVSNIYTRRLGTGNFVVINQHLVNDLEEINLWNEQTLEYLIAFNGKLDHFKRFLNVNRYTYNEERIDFLVNKYKTMFEIDPTVFIRYSRHRAIYIDQTQSLNMYISSENNNADTIQGYEFYAQRLGLKTLLYYLRQEEDAKPFPFNVSNKMIAFRKDILDETSNKQHDNLQQTITTTQEKIEFDDHAEDEGCKMCGS